MRAKAGRRHRQAAERIALEGVEAERHDQRVRREGARCALIAGIQRFEKTLVAGFARQRQVEIVAEAGALAALVGMAPEERIEAHRVGMERDGQHVGARVEDALRAVAVMQVDVEDRDARGALCAGAARRSPNC